METSPLTEVLKDLIFKVIFDKNASCGGGGSTNSDFCLHFCLGESSSSSPRSEARQCSSSLHVAGTFQAAAPTLELRAGESVSEELPAPAPSGEHLGHQQAALSFTQPQSLPGFTTRSYRNSLPGTGPWAEEASSGAGTPCS